MRVQQQTSLEAYNAFKDKIPTDHEAILTALEFNPNQTYMEIAKLCRFQNPNKVSRRIPELIRLDKIEKSGERICSIGKRSCSTYAILKQ